MRSPADYLLVTVFAAGCAAVFAAGCGSSSSSAVDAATPAGDASAATDAAPGTATDAAPGTGDAAPTSDGSTPSPTNFAAAGTYAVATSTGSLSVTGCSLGYSLYTPTGTTNAPLVILGHGFARGPNNMVDLAKHLASFGARVATPDYCHSSFIDTDHPQNAADAVALATNLKAGAPVLYAGHSAGGLSALLAATTDTTAVAVLGLDLTDANDLALTAAAGFSRPALGIVGEPSSCNASGNGRSVFAAITNGLRIHVVSATHCDFESPTGIVCTAPCGAQATNRVSVINALAAAFVAWQFGLDATGQAWVVAGGSEFERLRGEGAIAPLP